jgi:hypothetical protein
LEPIYCFPAQGCALAAKGGLFPWRHATDAAQQQPTLIRLQLAAISPHKGWRISTEGLKHPATMLRCAIYGAARGALVRIVKGISYGC